MEEMVEVVVGCGMSDYRYESNYLPFQQKIK